MTDKERHSSEGDSIRSLLWATSGQSTITT